MNAVLDILIRSTAILAVATVLCALLRRSPAEWLPDGGDVGAGIRLHAHLPAIQQFILPRSGSRHSRILPLPGSSGLHQPSPYGRPGLVSALGGKDRKTSRPDGRQDPLQAGPQARLPAPLYLPPTHSPVGCRRRRRVGDALSADEISAVMERDLACFRAISLFLCVFLRLSASPR